MSKRLGEVLIERGRITAEQLELALRNQLMLGGHLGTCLIELGYADEDTIGQALSSLLRVPYARRSMLAAVPPTLVRIFSKRVVEECQAIPFESDEKSLGVAMVDPRNLPLLDELRFASGMRIVPWVSPEVRIVEAMEAYYDIPRRTRYIAISRVMDRMAEETTRAPVLHPAALPASPPSRGAEGPAAVDLGVEYGYGRSWIEVAEELSARDPSLGIRRRADAEPPAGPAADLPELALHLCRAAGKDAIARDVLDFTALRLERAGLLAVRDDEVRVWRARGFEEARAEADPFKIETNGVFDHLLGRDHYLGPAGSDPAELRFFAWLGIEPPMEIVLVPIHLSDRLVAFFYGDGGPDGRIEGTAEEFRRLGRMIGLALNTVIYKKKILSAASPSDSRVPR